jgi:hypothetical protein
VNGVKRLNQKIGPGPIGRVFGFYIKWAEGKYIDYS